MNDTPQNPNPFRLQDGDAFAFSDKVERVPFENFDYEILDLAATAPAANRDWAQGFLAALQFIGAGSNPARRAHLAEYALGISTAKNQIELAARLSISPAAVCQQLNSLKISLAQLQTLFADMRRAELNFGRYSTH